MTRKEFFKGLPALHTDNNVLLITHNDLDGSGAAVLSKLIFENIEVEHVGNACMGRRIKEMVRMNGMCGYYDIIIACDISCSEDDAEEISRMPGAKDLVILDHHDTALFLNKYTFGRVCASLMEDSDIRVFYGGESEKAHSSGTSLLYDWFDHEGLFDNLKTEKISLFVQMVAAYDTWDWVNLFDSEEKYRMLDILFGVYTADFFEDVFLKRIKDADGVTSLFSSQDELMVKIEQKKEAKSVENISKSMRTGTMKIHGKAYPVSFCHANRYMDAIFEYMKRKHPESSLYVVDYGNGISVRAVSDDIHVGMLLKEFGGGGHPGAGGVHYALKNKLNLISETLGGADIILDKSDGEKENTIKKG